MKAAQREVFLALSRVPIPWPKGIRQMSDPSPSCLCTFCKYVEWDGRCFETEVHCRHTLEQVVDGFGDVEEGADCWGFRSQFPVDTIAEFVGQRLQGQFVELPG